jgi:hypothetical protein
MDIFNSIVIATIVITILSRVGLNVIVYLIVGSLIVYYFYKPKKEKDFVDKNPELAKVFMKLYPFYRFDPVNYKSSVKSANDLVELYESAKLGHRLPNQTIDLAEKMQRDVLNSMEAIMNSLPTTIIGNYEFQSGVLILQKIIQQIVDNIKLIYDDFYDRNGPSIYHPPPSTRSGPWANPLKAKDYNKNWNFFY